MNEEALNLSIRKFLKTVGVSSQRAIERAVADATAAGAIAGTESFPAKMTLEIAGLKLNIATSGGIRYNRPHAEAYPCDFTGWQ